MARRVGEGSQPMIAFQPAPKKPKIRAVFFELSDAAKETIIAAEMGGSEACLFVTMRCKACGAYIAARKNDVQLPACQLCGGTVEEATSL